MRTSRLVSSICSQAGTPKGVRARLGEPGAPKGLRQQVWPMGLLVAGVLVFGACGGAGGGSGGGNSGGSPAAPAESPTDVSLIVPGTEIETGGTLLVSVRVVGTENTSVNWSVDDVANGNPSTGIISGAGETVTYIAPETEGTHVLVATSVLDPSKSASARVSIRRRSQVASVAVSPTTFSLGTGAQKQFAATVTGTGSYSTAVSWSAQRGSITSGGLYTAPSSGGSDVVTARSTQDSGKTGSASLTVTAPAPTTSITSVAVSPTTFSLGTGAQKQFAATVTGTGSYSTAVSWSAQRGSITSGGLYTAPSSGGSDVVTARSAQDTAKSGTASLTVTAPVVASITSVAVSPTTFSLGTGVQKQFAATVTGTGSYSTAVSWSAQRGSITSGGLYTAPSSGGSDVVTARSAQDTAKSGTASLTVTAPSAEPVLGPLGAFPGAEGMGAGATGGRGGVVYTVNSLDDVYSEGTKYPTPNNGPNGPVCTLRDALQAQGRRTVVFSVSGTITLHGPLYPVPGDLTIAGQTSPGGIQIRGDGTFGTGGHLIHLTGSNYVIRYIRIRPGAGLMGSGNPGLGGIGAGSSSGVENHMIDHCSFEWDGNKPIAWGGIVKKTTLSWNLMGEGFYTGPLVSYVSSELPELDNSSFDGHHNIFAYFDHRLPYTNNKYVRWVNNLTFGYLYGGLMRGNTHLDMVGNVFDGISARVSSDPYRREIRWADTVAHNEGHPVPGGDAARFYMQNNFGPSNPNGTLDNFSTMLRIASSENGQLNDSPVDSQFKSSVPTSMPDELNAYPISVMHLNTYTDLRSLLAPTVGAYQRLTPEGAWTPNRDSLDTKVINSILNPSTSPSSLVTSCGTYPTLAGGSPASDSDGDGMPDVWEDAHGLNKFNASDRNTQRSGAGGYTNLDLYLSGLFPNGTPLP